MVFMHKTVGYSLSQRIIIVMFITQKSLLPGSNIPTEHWHDGNDRSAKSLVAFLPVPKPKGDCIKKHPPVQPAPTAGTAGRAEGRGDSPISPGGNSQGLEVKRRTVSSTVIRASASSGTRSGHGTETFAESGRGVKSHRHANKTPKEVLTSEFSSSQPDAATHQDFNGQEENLEMQIPVQVTPGDWWRKSSGQDGKK